MYRYRPQSIRTWPFTPSPSLSWFLLYLQWRRAQNSWRGQSRIYLTTFLIYDATNERLKYPKMSSHCTCRLLFFGCTSSLLEGPREEICRRALNRNCAGFARCNGLPDERIAFAPTRGDRCAYTLVTCFIVQQRSEGWVDLEDVGVKAIARRCVERVIVVGGIKTNYSSKKPIAYNCFHFRGRRRVFRL